MTDADSGPALWRALAAEIKRRGSVAIVADVERAVGRIPAAGRNRSAARTNPTSLVIRLSNELRSAQASMHRAVIIARVLAALPPNRSNENG